MPEWVRVKDKDTGHKLTVLAQELENNPDAYAELKQDAVDHNGDPLPPEFSDAKSAGTTKAKTATDNTKE